jgi:hypothetical protein
MDSSERAKLLSAYQRYLDAFNANDIDAINNCVKFPLAYIGDGEVKILDYFPITPAEMKAAKGWGRSEGFEVDVVAISATKAHLVMRNTRRLRNDGSLIEEATGFYAYTKHDDDWKMFAISDITFPAQG